MKKVVRLTESELKHMIMESAKSILREHRENTNVDISEINDAFFNSEGEGWIYMILSYLNGDCEECTESSFVIFPAPDLDLNQYSDDVPITLGSNQQLQQISDEPISREEYEMKRSGKIYEAVTRAIRKYLK